MDALLPESPVHMLVLRGVAVFAVVQALLRVSGKRPVSQMGPAELVPIVLIAESVSNALSGEDRSIAGGVIVAATLVACSLLLEYAAYRWRAAERVIEGTPTVVIHRGKVVESALRREWLRRGDLLQLLREQGLEAVGDVDLAVLSNDGSLSILKRAQGAPRSQGESSDDTRPAG